MTRYPPLPLPPARSPIEPAGFAVMISPSLAELRADLAFLLDDGPEHAADPASVLDHERAVADLRSEIRRLERAEQKQKASGES